jgi:hypothetical protein
MGMIQTEITLKNAFDESKAREGLIGEQKIRAITVTAVVIPNQELVGVHGDIVGYMVF